MLNGFVLGLLMTLVPPLVLCNIEYIVTIMDEYKRGMDWRMDLLITYTHDSELQALVTLSLVYTLYKSLEHAKSSQSSLDVSWQRILTVETPYLPSLRSSYHNRPCRTLVNYQLTRSQRQSYVTTDGSVSQSVLV
jgi:hypothetical protein